MRLKRSLRVILFIDVFIRRSLGVLPVSTSLLPVYRTARDEGNTRLLLNTMGGNSKKELQKRRRRRNDNDDNNVEDEDPTPTLPRRIRLYPVQGRRGSVGAICGGLAAMLVCLTVLGYYVGRGDTWWLGGSSLDSSSSSADAGGWRRVLAQRLRQSHLYHWWYNIDNYYYDESEGEWWSWRNLA